MLILIDFKRYLEVEMQNEEIARNEEIVDRFLEYTTPGMMVFRSNETALQLSGSCPDIDDFPPYDVRTIKWTVPKGNPFDMEVRIKTSSLKAQSVFISMSGFPYGIQFYKPRGRSQLVETLYIDPMPNDIVYCITMASKANSLRETKQPWINAHPVVDSPYTGSYGMRTIWEANASYPAHKTVHMRVVIKHPSYASTFEKVGFPVDKDSDK